jgi:prepilin-type N-terminal cleavage/methylation domain-containing protein
VTTDKKGFTLVETIVALTIFSFVVVTIALIYLNGYKAYAQNSGRVDVQENLRISLNQMARDLRGAVDDVTVYKKVNQKNWEVVDEGEEGTKISYRDPEDNLISYQFDDKDEEVEVKRGQRDSFHPISSHITDLKFRFDENERIITITIQGEKKKGKPEPIELTTRVYLRAN